MELQPSAELWKRRMPKLLIALTLLLVSLLGLPERARAVSGWACFGAALAEIYLPGLGYGLLGDWDKALIFGGARWASANKYYTYSESPDYQEEVDQIYRETELSDEKTQLDIYYSRETFYANAHSSIYGNLTFLTIYDLYDGGCEENTKTYGLLAAPFRLDLWGGELTFWAPTVYISAVPLDDREVIYHVDEDLSRDEMLRMSFLQYQLVGIGEEVLFRGVIQRSLFNAFDGVFSSNVARWTSIVLGAGVFGAAHSGAGLSANSGSAFVAGLYLGYVYHPEPGTYDLEQAIAIHSWWDTILMHRTITGARFKERQPGEDGLNPVLQASYPLFGFTYRF
jgi:membrane protease YdiL (CAAX protease family)